ncbi:hypothetical protein SAMN04488544_1824 [Microlunatus sagamiharensis]|uniref:Four helix bundle sensory module for signal transduction n=1 Tax=Microlunatus sagamiharensis TaxID=546874 RepID=A0A1H2MCU5_9ACTN|nr:hypothetical protein [Microlunatus sagamiharensis]SDU90999.1 hypothetical protein SAMN04488544_1824 [Microlunatus sagamiharensis]
MSQTSATAPPLVAPRPAPAAAPAPAPPVALGAVPPEVAAPTSGTPQRLRRLRAVVVTSGVALAVLGTLAMALLTLTLRQAAADVEQLVRVQTIETDLLVADANATNTFLVGGLESPERRAAYDAALADVADLVARSAQAQPADAAALSALNAQVLDYAGLVEAARANNRQGLPVGAQYLREASNGLRADALPVADALVEANISRANASLTTGWGWVLPVLALGATVAFVVVQVRVARQFRRRVNPGLLTGSLVLLLLTVVSFSALAVLAAQVASARSDFDDVRDVGTARVQANLAKSSESLTLVARGSGQAYEDSWQSSSEVVLDRLGGIRDASSFTTRWRDYADVHAQVRDLDDGGRWDEAVALATGSDAGTSNAAFAPFDASVASYATSTGEVAVAGLRDRVPGLVLGCVLTLLAGFGAAWAGSRGIAARLREYR